MLTIGKRCGLEKIPFGKILKHSQFWLVLFSFSSFRSGKHQIEPYKWSWTSIVPSSTKSQFTCLLWYTLRNGWVLDIEIENCFVNDEKNFLGGDDVQQLCDAGEEEFLEIMALVGMASKPLHVRRLQKSLHEWMTNPSIFQSPVPPNSDAPPPILFNPEPGSISQQLQQQRSLSGSYSTVAPSFSSPQAGSSHSASHGFCSMTSTAFGTPPTISSSSSTSFNVTSLNPSLTESQISRIVTSADRLARTLPKLQPKTQNMKKRSARELEQVIAMSDSDPRRMDEIRKFSAIYGRFDCKRKPEKPLTLHEVCVNEAAAQICKFIPALLTRRDELFPLARQVVRDSGFGHSATIRLMSQGHSHQSHDDSEQQSKRSRLASSGSGSDMGKVSRILKKFNSFRYRFMLNKLAFICFQLTSPSYFCL